MDVFVTGFWPGTATEAYTTHVCRTHFSDFFKTWFTAANSGEGWDKAVGWGANRQVVHDRGFRIGGTSRNPSGLTVVSIMTGRHVVAAEYSGVPGIV